MFIIYFLKMLKTFCNMYTNISPFWGFLLFFWQLCGSCGIILKVVWVTSFSFSFDSVFLMIHYLFIWNFLYFTLLKKLLDIELEIAVFFFQNVKNIITLFFVFYFWLQIGPVELSGTCIQPRYTGGWGRRIIWKQEFVCFFHMIITFFFF